jgi:hypothetical protein
MLPPTKSLFVERQSVPLEIHHLFLVRGRRAFIYCVLFPRILGFHLGVTSRTLL